jgi:hypothetical protein
VSHKDPKFVGSDLRIVRSHEEIPPPETLEQLRRRAENPTDED